MKKYLFVFALVLMSAVCFAQEAKPLKFQEVIPCEGKSQVELKAIVKKWVTQIYKYPKAVERFSNDDELDLDGRLTYRPKSFSTSCLPGEVTYDLIIDFKDNKIRVTMKDMFQSNTGKISGSSFVHDADVTKEQAKDMKVVGFGVTVSMYNTAMKEARKKCSERWDFIVSSLKKTLIEENTDDNW